MLWYTANLRPLLLCKWGHLFALYSYFSGTFNLTLTLESVYIILSQKSKASKTTVRPLRQVRMSESWLHCRHLDDTGFCPALYTKLHCRWRCWLIKSWMNQGPTYLLCLLCFELWQIWDHFYYTNAPHLYSRSVLRFAVAQCIKKLL